MEILLHKIVSDEGLQLLIFIHNLYGRKGIILQANGDMYGNLSAEDIDEILDAHKDVTVVLGHAISNNSIPAETLRYHAPANPILNNIIWN